jgi:hypothetical protein
MTAPFVGLFLKLVKCCRQRMKTLKYYHLLHLTLPKTKNTRLLLHSQPLLNDYAVNIEYLCEDIDNFRFKDDLSTSKFEDVQLLVFGAPRENFTSPEVRFC